MSRTVQKHKPSFRALINAELENASNLHPDLGAKYIGVIAGSYEISEKDWKWAKQFLSFKSSHMRKWLKHLLFPRIFPLCRIPQDFPYETGVARYNEEMVFTVGSTGRALFLCCFDAAL